MRFYDQGSCFRVTISERDLSNWCDTFPCSGLRGVRGVSATFEKRSGDLVDHNIPEHADGYVADCLCDDLKAYGEQRIAHKVQA